MSFVTHCNDMRDSACRPTLWKEHRIRLTAADRRPLLRQGEETPARMLGGVVDTPGEIHRIVCCESLEGAGLVRDV